jgi:hypothetical protein
LHHTLQSIARQRAHGSDPRNQKYFQTFTSSPPASAIPSQKQKTPGVLLATRSHQPDSDSFQMRHPAVMANSIAFRNFHLSVSLDIPARNHGLNRAVRKAKSGNDSEFLR